MFRHHGVVLSSFVVSSTNLKKHKPTKTSEPNYGALTFPLHEGIRRHPVAGLDRATFVNISFFSPCFLSFIIFFYFFISLLFACIIPCTNIVRPLHPLDRK